MTNIPAWMMLCELVACDPDKNNDGAFLNAFLL